MVVKAARDNHFSTVLRLGALGSAFASALGRFLDATVA